MKKILTLVIVTIFFGCTTEVDFGDLAFITKSRDFVIADGTDTVTFVVTFNNEANIDQISAKATVMNGSFTDNDDDELTIEPVRDITGKIESIVEVRGTTSAANTIVRFNINEYTTKFELSPQLSIPSNISLNASAFSVLNNFDGEITLTGSLSNEIGRKVSSGNKVKFEDFFADGSPVNGQYRAQSLSSGADSKVSTVYSPGEIDENQTITLRVTVLDDNGEETNISDSIEIFITTEN
ncbi:hypothetical protein [uncultured Aquimarina sp.]|uniref:hypothetical protein n=1 Tax=uncultured Aquimarina sp. TaxID=575652 RepID=UPI00261B9993|nr:hypothetical protein [uncultured Aquimarina sp.]